MRRAIVIAVQHPSDVHYPVELSNDLKWKQEYLKRLQDDHRWPYLDMICIVNHDEHKTAVLKYENGTYILIPDVHPNHPFEVPENARRGTKEFLEVLVQEGWKPD